MRSQHVVLALVSATLALTTACDPDDVPDSPNEASAFVDVGADASGVVVVAFGSQPDEAAITGLGETIDGAVFDGRTATSHVTGNDGGIPMLEYRSSDVFEPGEAPTVAIDTRRLCDDLMASGVTDVEIGLSLPMVETDSSITPNPDGDVWHVQSCGESPHGSVVLRPDPGQFWRQVLLVVLVVLANASLVIIGTRSVAVPRWAPWALAAIGVASAIAVIAAGGATAGDNMEVAGRMGHGANLAYFFGSLVIVLVGPIAAIAQPFYWRLPRDERPRLRRRTTTS